MIYNFDITEADKISVWIPAQVMARVIVCDNFKLETINGEDVLCPKSIAIVNEICPAPEKSQADKLTADETEAEEQTLEQPPCYLCAHMTKKQIL